MYYNSDNTLLSSDDYLLLINNAINYILSIENDIVLTNSSFSKEYDELKQELLTELCLLREKVTLNNV